MKLDPQAIYEVVVGRDPFTGRKKDKIHEGLWLKQVQGIMGLVNTVKIYCTVNMAEVNLNLNFQLIVPNLV